MTRSKNKKTSFKPVINNMTEILILGTMPSDVSIRTGEYYANSKNQFWKIIFTIFNNGLVEYDYNIKTELLLKNKIGLWDVLSKAHRPGSSDLNILDEEINDFQQLFKTFPNIKMLIFNGKKPAEYFRANNNLCQEKEYYVLPSTSSSNTKKTFDIKLREWKVVLTKNSC
jgi:hypoxanthine-DNA glycosylase